MTPAESRLLRHLITAVVVKLVLLAALWWVFVREAHVSADADQTAARISASPAPNGVPQ